MLEFMLEHKNARVQLAEDEIAGADRFLSSQLVSCGALGIALAHAKRLQSPSVLRRNYWGHHGPGFG